MKVVNASFFYNEKLETECEFLEQQYTITGWAEALQKKGIDVIVVNRFFRNSSFEENKVQYHFFKDKFGARLRAWQVPLQYFKLIRGLNADVIHLHHLTLSLQTFILRLLLSKKTAIIVQHHGGKSPNKFKRILHNLLINSADGFFFTSSDQGDEWFLKKMRKKIFPVMEGATFFDYANRNNKPAARIEKTQAREKTGIKGSPVFLWVGRLDENKDPLTVLDGFELIRSKYPETSLYMIYSEDKLLTEVHRRIENSTFLKRKVHLLGMIPHDKIEYFYTSADYFILGSHYEGSGYALSEALRCGCVPVVTGIPSFRTMTNNGKLGSLWIPGDKKSLAEAIINVMEKPLENEAKACMIFFANTLSFDSIASVATRYYQQVMDSRKVKKSQKPPAVSHA